MNIVLSHSLSKGTVLIDYAYSSRGSTLDLSIPDYVGIIAAYLDRGRLPINLEEELSDRLGKVIGERASQLFETFDDDQGRGLWSQGPAMEDVRLTSKKLLRRFSKVNARHDQLMNL